MNKILLAEDDNDMRRFLAKALANAGYDVISYDNGASAYERLREEPFTLLLTDIVMPEMDGGDVQVQLAGDPQTKDIPVIMLTALVDENETSPGAVAQSGATNVLAKPVNMVILLECLDDVTKDVEVD